MTDDDKMLHRPRLSKRMGEGDLMRCYAIYVLHDDVSETSAALAGEALRRIKGAADYLLVVALAPFNSTVGVLLADLADAVVGPHARLTFKEGIRLGLKHIYETAPDLADCVLVTGSHMAGPIGVFEPYLERALASDADLVAPYFHAPKIDPRLAARDLPARIPYFDFTFFKRSLLAQESFRRFWDRAEPSSDYWSDFLGIVIAFGQLVESSGFKVEYLLDPEQLESFDPRMFEVHKLVELGGPVVPKDVFLLDPLIHDLQAIYARRALDALALRDPELCNLLWNVLLTEAELRTLHTNLEEHAVLDDRYVGEPKDEWNFGTVAVFIHAFYIDVLKDIWPSLKQLPGKADLYISTASEENKGHIEAFIADQGWPRGMIEVRVVAANRGRDMSALFITFQDVVLAGNYEVALRLHSKRTPQVGRQIGNSFRDHLLDNLIFNSDYVRNLYDVLDQNPKIGLVIPPTVHIGFGTLGHAWYTNKAPMLKLAAQIGIKVPVDRDTPVAAYGTMFWFRTEALRPLFEHPWKWTDFNPEPHHVDGGLAHLLERLMGYCAQSRHFRTLTICNRYAAARNYVKLEYKLQLLAAQLPSHNISMQYEYLLQKRSEAPIRRWIHKKLERLYADHVVRRPRLLNLVRPLAHFVRNLIALR
ncbi:rhamnan synthesis F family protein [Mesorhizobium ciceri]|uniref:rhamnan synthesis F family protein n=2 Tax=Mesorhizobium ciceri TaxID=39645 RepID=UPI0009EDAA21|nr:rhamnan synthesis F family protein [Mesorhizobium ciceri]